MIVFDLDGTLIDSSRDLAEAASELVQELGGAPLTEAEVVGMVGDGAPVLVARALSRVGLDPATPGALARLPMEQRSGQVRDCFANRDDSVGSARVSRLCAE